MIPEARNQSGVSMPVDVSHMRTAAAMLAAGGLKLRDIAVAFRINVEQVRAWLSHSSMRSDGTVLDDGR